MHETESLRGCFTTFDQILLLFFNLTEYFLLAFDLNV